MSFNVTGQMALSCRQANCVASEGNERKLPPINPKEGLANGNASIVGVNRVIFNIKGNDYRLVVKLHYDRGVVYVRFVGSHREYDRIDAETI